MAEGVARNARVRIKAPEGFHANYHPDWVDAEYEVAGIDGFGRYWFSRVTGGVGYDGYNADCIARLAESGRFEVQLADDRHSFPLEFNIEIIDINSDRKKLRELIWRVVTGDGAQMENVDFDESYWRTHIKEAGSGEDIEISVGLQDWLEMLAEARRSVGE